MPPRREPRCCPAPSLHTTDMPRPSRRCSTIRATKPLGKNQGRGVASGYWFNGGGESSATVHVNDDGTVVVATGSPDIGGSCASMAIMAAEMLGLDYDQVRPLATSCSSPTQPIIARAAKHSSVACRSAAPRPRRVNVSADEARHHGVDCDAVRPCTAQGEGGCVRAHRGGRRAVVL